MELPDELVGKWLLDESGRVVGDEIENRIWDLVRNRFVRAGERDCGWTVLYRDPTDGSFWELTLPQGELQGGGPAQLNRLSTEQVSDLYPDANV
jgi:hypothetical protein